MNLLIAVFLFSVVLLALDLLTAPKHSENVPRVTNLKESRRAA